MTALAADAAALTSPTWLLVVTLVLGNGTFLTLLITGFLNRRKTAAEAAKADAEGDVASSSATEALVRTSLSLLQPYTEGLSRFSEEAGRLRLENEALRQQQTQVYEENRHLARVVEGLRLQQEQLNKENLRLAGQLSELRTRLGDLDGDVRKAEGR